MDGSAIGTRRAVIKSMLAPWFASSSWLWTVYIIFNCFESDFHSIHIVTGTDGAPEEAVAAYLISVGNESCRVGFLPRSYIRIKQSFLNRMAQVVELYRLSDNSHKRNLNHRNSGMAVCVLLDEIPVLE
jgi:hypothetical protein